MQLIEWLGAMLGIAGALIISMNRPWSRIAWPIWVASNVALVAVAAGIGAWGICTMQAVFIVININGVWQWWVRPQQVARRRGNYFDDRSA